MPVVVSGELSHTWWDAAGLGAVATQLASLSLLTAQAKDLGNDIADRLTQFAARAADLVHTISPRPPALHLVPDPEPVA